MQKVIYLAGPMTGMKDWNKPEFDRVAKILSDLGNTVLNPASYIPLNMPGRIDHSAYLKIAFAMVDAAEMLVFLPGWKISKGANMERDYAVRNKKPCIEWKVILEANGWVDAHEE